LRSPFTSDRVIVAAALEAASTELPLARVREIVTALDEELTLLGYSASTRDAYRLQAQRFLKWLRRDPTTASSQELRAYLLDMQDSELSASYVRQARAALGILYKSVLGQPEKVAHLPQAKKEKKLPLVLSRDEVRWLLEATSNLRDKALLTVIYSLGGG
jgi:integrase/recombinase XerD